MCGKSIDTLRRDFCSNLTGEINVFKLITRDKIIMCNNRMYNRMTMTVIFERCSPLISLSLQFQHIFDYKFYWMCYVHFCNILHEYNYITSVHELFIVTSSFSDTKLHTCNWHVSRRLALFTWCITWLSYTSIKAFLSKWNVTHKSNSLVLKSDLVHVVCVQK